VELVSAEKVKSGVDPEEAHRYFLFAGENERRRTQESAADEDELRTC
jgi:hypothetical protein